jgi:hypothetical protein
MKPLQRRMDAASKGRSGRGSIRRLVSVAAIAAMGLTLGVAATPASAKVNKADFLRFINCPVEQGKLCTYGETLSGEFKIGTKTVPVTVPTILQGGLATEGFSVYPLIPPKFGAEALSKTPQPVPGGLTGLTEIIGGEVHATAEQAGTIFVRPIALAFGEHKAIELPIRVHLENELLGPNCYIGSEAEPIVLGLTDGETEPPAGTTPISGEVGTTEGLDNHKITEFKGNKLVDNGFSAPAAKGCGTSPLLEPVITALVNTAEGLPAASGNLAVLNGNLFTAFSADVAKYDKKALKEKEHPKK